MMDEELINFDDYKDSVVEEEAEPVVGFAHEQDDDDIFGEGSGYEPEAPEEEHEEEAPTDYISEILRRKGFADKDNLPILDEDGDPTTIKFDDLSKEEQMDFLTAPDFVLSDDEINTINFLRNNNMTLKQYVDGVIKNTQEGGLAAEDDQVAVVDNATDEEIFKVDMRHKYPDLTEEEIENELDNAMIDEETFKKKVNSIRNNFRRVAEQANQEKIQQRENEVREQQRQFYESVNDAANEIDSIQGIDIDDNDKEDVMRFLFEEDVNNQTPFQKMIQNPRDLFKVALYAVKGEEAMNMLHKHYREQITEARRQGKKGASTGSQPTVVKSTSGKSSNKSRDEFGMSDYFK